MGSKQMQQIRMSLRGKAVVLMGKNTMMRKAIRGHLENNPALEKSVSLSSPLGALLPLPGEERSYKVTFSRKLLFADCCLTSGEMWASCSPRRTSLRSGTCCWPTR